VALNVFISLTPTQHLFHTWHHSKCFTSINSSWQAYKVSIGILPSCTGDTGRRWAGVLSCLPDSKSMSFTTTLDRHFCGLGYLIAYDAIIRQFSLLRLEQSHINDLKVLSSQAPSSCLIYSLINCRKKFLFPRHWNCWLQHWSGTHQESPPTIWPVTSCSNPALQPPWPRAGGLCL
jgi:hypothetical protein